MEMSSCLIGEDSLLIQCGNLLLTHNHTIRLVISSSISIQEWANDNGLPYLTSINELSKTVPLEVDYLFSIVNSQILPPSILDCARIHAINYHDSILPKYAGLNATSWSILNDEKEHGITWHIMNENVDEGDIVEQRIFPIESTDTALTLNLRCYENAIISFSAILDAIEKNRLVIKPQILNERTYFSSTHHLPNFGVIDWQSFSAEIIERYTRALSLGHYNNNVGTLKLILKNDYVIVSQAELSDNQYLHQTTPGTVLAIETDALYIATITRPCKITHFLSKIGETISVAELVKRNSIDVGSQLSAYVGSEKYIKQYHHTALKNEHHWISRIKQLSEHNAFPLSIIKPNVPYERLEPAISLKSLFPNKTIKQKLQILLTATVLYLYYLNDHEQLTFSIVHQDYDVINKKCSTLFSAFLPFIFNKKGEFSLQDAIDTVNELLCEQNKHSIFLNDIAARHPILQGNKIDPGIVINLKDDKKYYPSQDNTILYFNIDCQQGEIEILHRMDLSYYGLALREIMANCTQHLVNILIKLVNHPHISGRHLCFLTQSERYKLLEVWGKGKKRYIPTESISTLFARQVDMNPERIAIYIGNQAISYGILSGYADQIASYLHTKKIPKQTFIGIYLNRSIEMLAVILGILKADCVYVPLDIKYPLLKIEQIIEDANLAHLFVQDNMLSEFADFFTKQKRQINLFSVDNILTHQPILSIINEMEKTNEKNKLAYIIFTSGTTGRPKGVVVTQKNVINYCKWFSETTHFDVNGIIDFSSSIAFDLSVPCTLAPLLVGGSIAIASDAEKTNPLRYLTHLITKKVTHTELTPGYLEMLLNYPDEIRRLVNLKFLLLGADVVPTNVVMKWLALCPEHQIVNEYGPTEVTVSATSYFINNNALIKDASVPIGSPAFNSTCYVLDKYKNLCPAGVKGELYIGGEQVTQGYLGRDALTQEKFIFTNLTSSNEIIYKTGDIVCWLPSGNLQFFGRNDHQIKIHGYRVELTAIESVLVKMSGIQQAVVIVLSGKLKENYLRAYLVTDSILKSSSEIREYLSSYLPSYMVPREFCLIKTVPLKENEKIDFTALEKMDYKLLTFDAQNIVENLNPTEKIIKRIWEQMFHTTSFSIEDDFFSMGGDSLMAVQFVSELEHQHAISLPLQWLFENPTIRSLAKKIIFSQEYSTQKFGDISSSPLVKLSNGKETTPLFLIHPVGGSIFWYKRLASYLEGKYTVYGIQDINLNKNNIRFKKLEDMASYYLKEIKKVYTGDNYCLGGASFGATVAFEMAHQLLNKNKTLQFLGLFDGWAHYPDSIMQEDTLDWLKIADDEHSLLNRETREVLIQLEQYRKSLLADYKVLPLNANATLFKASEVWPSFSVIDDAKNGWAPYVRGEVVTLKTPGNHETMFFEPHIAILAKYLESNLEAINLIKKLYGSSKKLKFETNICDLITD